MFRRKEEIENEDNDLLSQADNDATIDTTSVAKESATDDVAAQKPAAAMESPARPSMPPAPKAPAPAAGFRPQPIQGIPQNRMPAPAEPRSTPAAAGGVKASKRILTVGNDIHMKGEIATCDRLVIEGSVDASLKDVHTVEIAQTGSFKGTAEIEDAEISGSFEGDLIVNGRLIIYSTGQVRGNIAYGEVEIERGGQLSGTIKTAAEAKASGGINKKAAA